MTTLLEVRNLYKTFKNVNAVNGISFAIPRGTCFGLLGPNGAGKTTTIEMMEGILPPSSGEVIYKGKPQTSDFKFEAGIQFQSTALMDYLTVSEVLDLFANFYRTSPDRKALIEQCHLGDFLDRPAAKLSGGQRQRVLLAVALINDPEIVFLDEPTTGLDPQSRRNFWELIESIKARGKTIVLTTHYMDEAEQLCDQLVIVDKGQIIAEGSPKALLKQHFANSFVCLDQETITPELAQTLNASSRGKQWIIATPAIEKTLQTLIQYQVDLSSLQVRSPSLDDLFLKLTGHSLRE